MTAQEISNILFFPVLRRGSVKRLLYIIISSFYSSPSCDGDRSHSGDCRYPYVSILPRLATGINNVASQMYGDQFLFFPVLRRGSRRTQITVPPIVSILPRLATGIACQVEVRFPLRVSILPRLATGIVIVSPMEYHLLFLFFPVLRRGSSSDSQITWITEFLFFPVLRRGSVMFSLFINVISFYSSPSCDGDR